MGVVGIASCSHYAWLVSSKIMGESLANTIENGMECRVHTPVDKRGLIACLKQSNYFIMHTHGAPDRFIDQRADDRQEVITTLSGVKDFPEFPNLKLVIMTACSVAGGENEKNIACELSKKIAKDGLVIANRYPTYGASYDFGERYAKPGWVAYQNGSLVLNESQIPPRITMADAYRIFIEYRKTK